MQLILCDTRYTLSNTQLAFYYKKYKEDPLQMTNFCNGSFLFSKHPVYLEISVQEMR